MDFYGLCFSLVKPSMRVEDFYAVPNNYPLSFFPLALVTLHPYYILKVLPSVLPSLPFLLPSSPASFSVYLSASECIYLSPYLRVGPNTSDRRDSSSSKLSFPHTHTRNQQLHYLQSYIRPPSTPEHSQRTHTTQQPYSLKALFPINIPLTSPSFLPPFLFSICSSANKLQYRLRLLLRPFLINHTQFDSTTSSRPSQTSTYTKLT